MTTPDYAEKIPNNVSLHDDRRLQRALESWQPNFLSWWESMGPTLPTQDVYLRTAVDVRPRGLGALRPRADAGLPVGHLPGRARPGPADRVRRAQGRARLAEGPRRVPGRAAAADRDPGRHRAGLGRAAAQPRRDRAVPVRPAQPLPGQRRRGPPPVGDGLPAARLLRPRGPGGGRGAAAPQLRQRGLAAHPRRVQRGDAGLALVLHVHLLHRPRRQVPARHAQGVRVRPAVADLRVHAQGRGAPHVRRHHRRRPGGGADRAGDGGERHRRHRRLRGDPADRSSRSTSTSTTASRSTCSAGRPRPTSPTTTRPG